MNKKMGKRRSKWRAIQWLREWNHKRLHDRRRGRRWIPYEEWIARNEMSLGSAVASQLVTLVVDVSGATKAQIGRMARCILAQSHLQWELLVVHDAASSARAGDLLAAVRSAGHAGMARPLGQWRGAGAAQLGQCINGEWACILPVDVLMHDKALTEALAGLDTCRHAEVIYADQDQIYTDGVRFAPHFKPDFNIEMLLSWNYIGRTFLIRTPVLMKLMAEDGAAFGDPAFAYDLLLKCSHFLNPAQILHVPRILFHQCSDELPDDEAAHLACAGVNDEDLKAIRFHVAAYMPGVEVDYLQGRIGFRLKFPLPTQLPLVSILIPTRNALPLVKRCIESLVAVTTYRRYEIILIDNGSDDPEALRYFKSLQDSGMATVMRDDRPFNYSALNNAATRLAKGELILLLNNDTECVDGEWLSEMVSHAVRPEVGCVGAKLLYPDGNIQHVGVIMGVGGVAGHAFVGMSPETQGYFSRAKLLQAISGVTAACLLVKREIYDAVGGLDEVNLPVAYNDVDFCLKVVELGYRNILTPFSVLYHHESATRGSDFDSENIKRYRKEFDHMRKRWGQMLDNDPAYNVNLTLDGCDFSLSPSPRPFVLARN